MTQYTNTYGTVYSVRDYKGEPRIMCRAKASCDWLISGTLAVEAAAANTIEGLQQVLDNHARTHGWQPLEGPASAEPPEIVDECSDLDLPYPGDVYRSAKGGQLYKIGELTNGKKTCYLTMRCNVQGGIWVPANSSVYPNLSDAQGEFEAWIRREQLEPVAPTMDAAAITDELAAKDPFKAEGTSITSASGADAGTSLPGSSCKSAPNFSPAPASPADAGVAAQNLCAAEPASLEADERMENFTSSDVATVAAGGTVASLEPLDSTSMMAAPAAKANEPQDDATESVLAMASVSTTFDFGADADTNAALMQDAQIFMAGSMARVMAAKRAHDRTANNYRGSWGKWCDLVGISRDTGDNMVRVAEQFGNIQIDGQNLIDIQPLKLLYAASKPSTPPEIRERVENLDITTYKQYQDAMTRIRTLENQNASLLHSYETERGKAEAADRRADAAQTERDAAESRARAAENRASGAQKLAEQRVTENAELKAKIRELENQPRDVAVVQPGEEQIEAWRREGADRMAATMQETVRKANEERLKAQNRVTYLQEQLATARPDADTCQRTADTLYETAENLRILLRTQLKQAQLSPTAYGKVVALVLQVARTLLDTVRVCAPDGYDMDSEEDDDFE